MGLMKKNQWHSFTAMLKTDEDVEIGPEALLRAWSKELGVDFTVRELVLEPSNTYRFEGSTIEVEADTGAIKLGHEGDEDRRRRSKRPGNGRGKGH